MKRTLLAATVVFSLAIFNACRTAHDAAEDTGQVAGKAGHVVAHGMEKTGHAVEHGGEKLEEQTQ